MTGSLLEVRDLNISFNGHGGYLQVVDSLSMSLQKGDSLGLVGESGCGKTVTALAIAGLLRESNCRVSGNIRFANPAAGKGVKDGTPISMAFQDSYSSLNPVLTVKKHLSQLIRVHLNLSPNNALEKAGQLLNLVGINKADEAMEKYPWELSGGMAQRVCIALALCCQPQILIADEPTSALDTVTGSLVMKTLNNLRRRLDLTLFMISHDLATVAQNCGQLMVMYMGRVVEEGPTQELLQNPLHPYTKRLVETFRALEEGRHDIEPISGNVPSYHDLPLGCSFHPRCHEAIPICCTKKPLLAAFTGGRKAACHLHSS